MMHEALSYTMMTANDALTTGVLKWEGLHSSKATVTVACSCGDGLTPSAQSVEAGAIRIFCYTKIL